MSAIDTDKEALRVPLSAEELKLNESILVTDILMLSLLIVSLREHVAPEYPRLQAQ